MKPPFKTFTIICKCGSSNISTDFDPVSETAILRCKNCGNEEWENEN